MGTSTHNIGQKGNTPLVPSWLDQPDAEDQLDTDEKEIYSTPIGEQIALLNQEENLHGISILMDEILVWPKKV